MKIFAHFPRFQAAASILSPLIQVVLLSFKLRKRFKWGNSPYNFDILTGSLDLDGKREIAPKCIVLSLHNSTDWYDYQKRGNESHPSYFEAPGVLKCLYESHGCSLTHDVRRVSFKAMYTEKVKPKEARLLTSQCSPPCDCRKTPRRPPRFLPSLSCEPE